MDLPNFQDLMGSGMSVLLHRGVLETPADQTLHVKQSLGRIDGGLDEPRMSTSGCSEMHMKYDEMGLTKT